MNAEDIRRWQRGWALCRGLPPATESDGALDVVLGIADRHTELVALSDADDVVASLASRAASAPRPTWLTVISNRPEPVAAVMRQHGLTVGPPDETFMATELFAGPAVETGFKVRVHPAHSVVRVELTDDDGAVVARGMAGLDGEDAVPHDVFTQPAYRGRGLGAAIMGRLTDEAVARGAKHGLLIASEDGKRLYTRLGWTALGTVVLGRRAAAV
jgi:GNAT superfamily N-acetyltransferase